MTYRNTSTLRKQRTTMISVLVALIGLIAASLTMMTLQSSSAFATETETCTPGPHETVDAVRFTSIPRKLERDSTHGTSVQVKPNQHELHGEGMWCPGDWIEIEVPVGMHLGSYDRRYLRETSTRKTVGDTELFIFRDDAKRHKIRITFLRNDVPDNAWFDTYFVYYIKELTPLGKGRWNWSVPHANYWNEDPGVVIVSQDPELLKFYTKTKKLIPKRKSFHVGERIRVRVEVFMPTRRQVRPNGRVVVKLDGVKRKAKLNKNSRATIRLKIPKKIGKRSLVINYKGNKKYLTAKRVYKIRVKPARRH